jgi:hypothetical protein
MADYSGILFNKSPMQLRSIGARGGRAYARNQRLRRARLALMPAPSPMAALGATQETTVSEAVALLDAQFPWLRAAERRTGRRTTSAYGTQLQQGARPEAKQ